MTKNNQKITRKRLITGGIALLVVALVALSLRPKPEPADFATVGRGPLLVTLDEEGETRVRDRYLVSAPVAGRVLRIELEPGDEVTADETVLATFQPSDPVPLDARSRAEAEAQVKAAQAALGRARADRQREEIATPSPSGKGQTIARCATPNRRPRASGGWRARRSSPRRPWRSRSSLSAPGRRR